MSTSARVVKFYIPASELLVFHLKDSPRKQLIFQNCLALPSRTHIVLQNSKNQNFCSSNYCLIRDLFRLCARML
jgi:hypothetical protein